ncbi:S24/S26 family peptidase [Natrinema salifodinae]|uniref:Signal peptidase, endoplasmic reticulum-type n=1 Tax=Natrinema salifodinae TaxID=1202768 RepID=A0A1I0QGC8_9EURY|nr:S26 family signal peptidase [Natrinema salifodinae]SEW26021.1 signal peptidase, endoplasmic reticulum-type [Natrinema salifodinae]
MDGPDGERTRDRSAPRDGRRGSDWAPSDRHGDPGSAPDAGPRTAADARDRGRVAIEDGPVRWLREADGGPIAAVRDVATSVAIVAVVGLLLFAISGGWPPLVAVESGSMEPHISQSDLVFIVDEGRFADEDAIAGTGVVTLADGRETDHERFGLAGDVVVFVPNGDPTATSVIHRAHFWVEADENWVETKADPAAMNGATCADIASCPAPHDGFVTKGDANRAYDQLPRSGAETTVVKPEWVTGKAMLRVPHLGELRLAFDSIRALSGVGSAAVLVASGAFALVLFAAAGARKP